MLKKMAIEQEMYQNTYGINLSRQKNASISQQINFKGKLKDDNGATMFFITENLQKIILNFSLDSLNITKQKKQYNIKKH